MISKRRQAYATEASKNRDFLAGERQKREAARAVLAAKLAERDAAYAARFPALASASAAVRGRVTCGRGGYAMRVSPKSWYYR